MRLVAITLLLATGLLAEEAPRLPEGASLAILVREVKGEVEVQTAPRTKWTAATAGLQLAPGAKICTGIDGQAVLQFGTNSVAIVSEASMFEIRSFGMKGDELVAEAFIDPGVAHVSVKQLEQFQTDFQVSTPRLTCSVRGSAYTVWSNGGAGLLDAARCDEHLAEVILANLERWVVATGLGKDTSDDTPQDTQSRQCTTDVTPQGSAPSEQVARLVLLIAHTLAQDPGSLTLGTSGSPSSGVARLQQFVQEHCTPERTQRNLAILRDAGKETIADFLETGAEELREIAQDKLDDVNEGRSEDPDLDRAYRAFIELRLCLAASQLLEDRGGIATRAEGALLATAVDNLDALEHLARDAETEGNGGIDEIRGDMFLFARRNGFPRFANEVFLEYIDDRFREDPAGLGQSNPSLLADRRGDFLDDGSGFSFNDLDDVLALADMQAHSPVAEDTMARLLITMLHTHFHIVDYALPPGNNEGQYGFEHSKFHEEVIGDLDGFRGSGDIDRFLATYVRGGIKAWEDRTGCEDDSDPQDPCFEPSRHYVNRLIDVLRGFRGATGRFAGYRSEQEHEAMHVLIGFSDVRHHLEPEDLTEFQFSHAGHQVELEAVELVGLAASADIFEGKDHHEEHDELLAFLQQQDPQEAQRRHDDFHDIASFGLDAYLVDWQTVQDQARLEALQPTTLGHALLDTLHEQFHVENVMRQPGNQPGQYDYVHDEFHQSVLDPLHTTLESSFPQFAHDLLGLAHLSWHDKTGVPLNPGQQAPGFAAHEHFHQSLGELHQDMHDATGTSDGGQQN